MTFKPTANYIRFLKKKEALDEAIRNMQAEMQRASFRKEWLAEKWNIKPPPLPEPEFSLEEITAAQDAMDD